MASGPWVFAVIGEDMVIGITQLDDADYAELLT